jgi:hypothetical protein
MGGGRDERRGEVAALSKVPHRFDPGLGEFGPLNGDWLGCWKKPLSHFGSTMWPLQWSHFRRCRMEDFHTTMFTCSSWQRLPKLLLS